MFRYNVQCRFFAGDPELENQWLEWLRSGHLQDVLNGGATHAEIVKLDAAEPTYEIRYRFPDRATFEAYERNHAPRLRSEGLEKFPADRGIQYQRWSGEVIHTLDADPGGSTGN